MSGLLKGLRQVLSVLEDMSSDDIAMVLEEAARLNGMKIVRAESVRTRRGLDAERKRTERGRRAESAATPLGVPSDSVMGDKGGSPISDLQSPSPLQSPALSSLGSPTTSPVSTGKTSGVAAHGRLELSDSLQPAGVPADAGTTSELQAHSSRAEAPRSPAFLTGETAPGSRGVGTAPSGKGDSVASELFGGDPAPSHALPELSTPPRRFNEAGLVDCFTFGVNEAGGVWTCARGKPHSDLAQALGPHAERWAIDPSKPPNMAQMCVRLGARWFAYCGGAPRDAWKAAAWLGEGAPERPRSAMPQRPEEAAQDLHERSRAVERRQATKRDAEYERREREAVRAPPEVQRVLTEMFSPAAIPPASGTMRKWTPELERQAAELMAEEPEKAGSG
jgi:hypothetical protein